MQTNARLAFQLLMAFVVVVVVFLGFYFVAPGSAIHSQGMRTKNLSNAKQLAIACRLYANEHEGRFPMHLSELEPDYVAPGTLIELRCASIGEDHDPRYTMDWLYFGGGFNETAPPSVLMASPQATTVGKPQKREVIRGDFSGSILDEDQYQELLAETVRQMRALDDAQHPAKPSPVDAAPK